jgi:acetyl-CoA carboxylase biotin carboxyl carrier protein
MTDAFERPMDDAQVTRLGGSADEALAAADLAAAGDALAPVPEPADPTPDGSGAALAEPAISETGAAEASPQPTVMEPGDASLLGLIDRLGALLERSDLTELEVEVGQTTVILRKPAAVTAPLAAAPSVAIAEPPLTATAAAGEASRAAPSGGSGGAPARPSVKAPLTGIWYASPTPGSAAFVEAGRELAVGQVVGLIEAMKLFNEIKSDIAGRVVRVVPDSGTLVKAKQPLIEVDPL